MAIIEDTNTNTNYTDTNTNTNYTTPQSQWILSSEMSGSTVLPPSSVATASFSCSDIASTRLKGTF
jgi:hypothetical protein